MNAAADRSLQRPGAGLLEFGLVCAALAASAFLIWLVTGDAVVTLAYVGALLVFGATAFLLARRRPGEAAPSAAQIDWSVTVAAIEQPGIAIAITDRANRLTCANSEFTRAFGTDHAPPGLELGGSAVEAMMRAARAAWRDGAAQLGPVEHGGKSWGVSVTRAGLSDEHLIWRFTAEAQSDPLADIAGHITGAAGRILSRAGIEAALVRADGIIQTAGSGFAERASGDARASLVGQDFASFLVTDERDRIYFAREGRKGSPQTLVHIPLAAPDEEVATGQGEALMLLLDAGVGIGGWGAEAQTGTPQLQALLEQLPLGLAMTDRDGHLLFANPAFMRAVGLEDRTLPPYPSDLVVKEDKGPLSDAVRRFGQGPANSGDMAVRLRASPEEPVSLGLAGVRGLGEPAVLLSLVDTTEETRLKRQVAQATKMQAVGQLAGGVAHDFNNVLTAIIGYCDLMLLRHTPGDSDYDDIQQIKANSNRAASLTRQLLAFSRQQTLRPEVLQLPDVVAEVGHLLKRLMGEKIEFRVHHDRNLGPVRADPQQLEQVIVNLAVNARDAIQSHSQKTGGDGTGRLTMATHRITAEDVRRIGSDIIPMGDYTALIVEDTGGGIPPGLMSKIFEPFFTTKETGKGTGLGLSTVYGIVKQSGGFIFVDNVEGDDGTARGARFTIYLPVHQAAEAPAPPAPAGAEPVAASTWSGGGHILLVEDEDMVRAVAERALTRQGYKVTVARDGEEGLERIREGGQFDLVVSDVVMPAMDGPAMARELREIVPDMPLLFMSGYAEEQLRNEIDIEHMHFIAKPFSVQQISDKVAEVLAARR